MSCAANTRITSAAWTAQLRGTARGFHGIRERTAVPEKLGVVVFGVPDGQVRKELGGFAHRAGVHNGQRDRAVDVPLAGNGNPLIGQLAQRDAGKSLQEHGRGPAVHACTGTVFFMDRLPDGQPGSPAKLKAMAGNWELKKGDITLCRFDGISFCALMVFIQTLLFRVRSAQAFRAAGPGMIEVHVQIAGRLLQGAGIIAVHTAYVVDIGTKDQALLPALPIFRLEPDVGPGGRKAWADLTRKRSVCMKTIKAQKLTKENFSKYGSFDVKAAEGNIALFQFPISGHGFQLRGTARGFHGIRERTAVPEKLAPRSWHGPQRIRLRMPCPQT